MKSTTQGDHKSSVSDVKAGDVIDPRSLGWPLPAREVMEVHNLGRKVGDGTVDWITFRVRPSGSNRAYTDALGPLRADQTVKWAGELALDFDATDDISPEDYAAWCEDLSAAGRPPREHDVEGGREGGRPGNAAPMPSPHEVPPAVAQGRKRAES